MHPEIQNIFHLPITMREVVANIVVATLCGTLLAIFYSQTHRGASYSFNLVKSIIMLSIITSFVMMVIGDNLARAFGMAALISLIKFRSSIKGAQDFMFIYLALAIGLSAGVGLYEITLVGTVTIILITWIVMQFDSGGTIRQEFTLQIISGPHENIEQHYGFILKKHCRKYRLFLSKTEINEKEIITRLGYHVVLIDGKHEYDLINEIQVAGVRATTLQFVETN